MFARLGTRRVGSIADDRGIRAPYSYDRPEHAEDVDYLCRIGFARHAHPPTDLSFELSLRSAQRERFGDRTGMHGRG